MSTPDFHWTKREAGFYTLDGTDYGVASMNATDADDGTRYVSRMEWAVIHKRGGINPDDSNDGENLDWFDTMREAKADAERRAEREVIR